MSRWMSGTVTGPPGGSACCVARRPWHIPGRPQRVARLLLASLGALALTGAGAARAADGTRVAAQAAPVVAESGGARTPTPGATHGDPRGPEQAPAHGDQPDLFGGDIGNVLVTLVIFVLLLAVLGRYAWAPLVRILQQREQAIHESLERARQERLEAEKLLAQYREQIDRAREQATAIVEEGRRDAEVVRQRIREEAQREAQQMIERARREVQLAADAARTELYQQAAELAIELAAGIVRRELSTEDHRELVSESLEKMLEAAKR